MKLLAICSVILTSLLFGATARAAFTFLEPTPYRSAADSPFDLSGLGSTFFLEDFEGMIDSYESIEANNPGLTVISGGFAPYTVDADDGVVDGLAGSGRGFAPTLVATTGTGFGALARFEFDRITLGRFPTHFGLVVTRSGEVDGLRGQLTVFGADDSSLVYRFKDLPFVSSLSVEDDRFIGVINATGISAVEVTFAGLRGRDFSRIPAFDHLQYGIIVPEPCSAILFLIAVTFTRRKSFAALRSNK